MNVNRAVRRSPRFKVALGELQTFTLDRLAVDGIPLWQLRVAADVIERIAHGRPQTVSTAHLQERCRKNGTGGGRYYTDAPGYGTLARLLVTLKRLGVLTWERCRFDPKAGKAPARTLQLQGRALAIVGAALRAHWIGEVSGSGCLRSQEVPPVQSALGAGAASPRMSSAESPPRGTRLDFSAARALGLLKADPQ